MEGKDMADPSELFKPTPVAAKKSKEDEDGPDTSAWDNPTPPVVAKKSKKEEVLSTGMFGRPTPVVAKKNPTADEKAKGAGRFANYQKNVSNIKETKKSKKEEVGSTSMWGRLYSLIFDKKPPTEDEKKKAAEGIAEYKKRESKFIKESEKRKKEKEKRKKEKEKRKKEKVVEKLPVEGGFDGSEYFAMKPKPKSFGEVKKYIDFLEKVSGDHDTEGHPEKADSIIEEAMKSYRIMKRQENLAEVIKKKRNDEIRARFLQSIDYDYLMNYNPYEEKYKKKKN